MSSSRLLAAPNYAMAAPLKSIEMSLGDLKLSDNLKTRGRCERSHAETWPFRWGIVRAMQRI